MRQMLDPADYPGATFYKNFSTKKDHNNWGKKTSDTVVFLMGVAKSEAILRS